MKNLIFLLCSSICLLSINNSIRTTNAAPTDTATATTTSTTSANIIPATPTYTVTIRPVVTAQSHQVVARNYNRLYVPLAAAAGVATPTTTSYAPASSYVPAVSTTTAIAAYPPLYSSYPYSYPTHTYATYPTYATTTTAAYNQRYGYYGYYPAYGYSYGYANAAVLPATALLC